MPTPPYPYIQQLFARGAIVPFLGAGASFGARDPSQRAFRARQPQNPQQWDVEFLPTADELARALADDAQYPADETRELTKVAQYFKTAVGRGPLDEYLNRIFQFRQEPGSVHKYLAAAAAAAPLLMVTTNYDDLVERAFADANHELDVVVHVNDPQKPPRLLWWRHGATVPERRLAKDIDIDLGAVSVLYKIHGSFDRLAAENVDYVITEDDYVEFLTRLIRKSAIPNVFAEPFKKRPFLFLGYGLYDWNLRVVLSQLHKRPGQIQSWAIEARPKELESMLWRQRGVIVYDDLTIDQFIQELGPPPAPMARLR